MRIGVDARVLSLSEIRGIANYVLKILKFWPNHNDEFILFYESGQLPDYIETQAEIIPVCIPDPPGTRFKVWNWLAMPKIVKKFNVDLMWCPANIPIPYILCKQVLTVHDTLLQETFRKHTIFNNFFYRIVVPFWSRNYTDKIVTVSSFSKERIQSLFKVNSERIQIIYNGMHTVPINYSDKVNAQKKLADSGIVLGRFIYALGAESSWKNTERLLRSFSYVHRQQPDLMLVVTGIQESALASYNFLVSSLGLDLIVKLIGFVEASTRDALYQCAELFVYPSLFEGFGFPPLEAMALGCPVICSDRASMPEVVGSGAHLVDCTAVKNIASAILELVNNEKKKKELIAEGFKNIARFSWRESAIAHSSLFLEV